MALHSAHRKCQCDVLILSSGCVQLEMLGLVCLLALSSLEIFLVTFEACLW